MTGSVRHLAKTKDSVRPLPSMVKAISLLAQRMSSYCLVAPFLLEKQRAEKLKLITPLTRILTLPPQVNRFSK